MIYPINDFLRRSRVSSLYLPFVAHIIGLFLRCENKNEIIAAQSALHRMSSSQCAHFIVGVRETRAIDHRTKMYHLVQITIALAAAGLSQFSSKGK